MESSETQNGDINMEVEIPTENDTNGELYSVNMNVESDVLVGSVQQTAVNIEVNETANDSLEGLVKHCIEQPTVLVGDEKNKDIICPSVDASRANKDRETNILSDNYGSKEDESEDSSSDESSDEDSTSESSEIDFEDDVSEADEEIEQPKQQPKISYTDTKRKSSGFDVNFNLLKLRDLSSIDVPPSTMFELMGRFMHIMEYDRSVMVESVEGIPTLNLGTILFRKSGEILGEVCDIIGNVKKPCYSLNFKTMEEIRDKNLEKDESVFYAPNNPDLTYLVREEDVIVHGTDASGVGDREASDEDYSDDEKEEKCKRGTRAKSAAGTSWPAERKKVRAKRTTARGSQPHQNVQSRHRNQMPSSVNTFSSPPPPLVPAYPQPMMVPHVYSHPSGFPVMEPFPSAPPNCPVPPPMYYGPPGALPGYPYPMPLQPMPNWPPHHQAFPVPQHWPPANAQQWPPANAQQWPPNPNPYHQGGQNPRAYFR